MTFSLKAIFLACLFLASACQAGNVEDLEARLRAAAESPDSQRLMQWLRHFNNLEGHLEMPKDSKDLVACQVCTDALNAFLRLFKPPGVEFTVDQLNDALKVCVYLILLVYPVNC